MAVIEYTAKRSLVAGHEAGIRYSIELEVQTAQMAVADIRHDERSPGGAEESVFERQDRLWTIRLAPVCGASLWLMREFLDSIESGETFAVWLWPEDVSPLYLKVLDDSHGEDVFMRCGEIEKDYFDASFVGLQVGGYDPAGSGGAGSGSDGATVDESVDIYSPDAGGSFGGLTPLASTAWDLRFAIATDQVPSELTIYGYDVTTGYGGDIEVPPNTVFDEYGSVVDVVNGTGAGFYLSRFYSYNNTSDFWDLLVLTEGDGYPSLEDLPFTTVQVRTGSYSGPVVKTLLTSELNDFANYVGVPDGLPDGWSQTNWQWQLDGGGALLADGTTYFVTFT